MELHQVRYFLAVCADGSFTRAARRCGVAQPSLTRAIQVLEAELGGRLFIRGARSTVPTELGRHVYRDLAGVVRAAERAARKASTFRNGPIHTPSNGGSYGQYPRGRSETHSMDIRSLERTVELNALPSLDLSPDVYK